MRDFTFWDEVKGGIKNFWQLPSFKEIMQLYQDFAKLKDKNFSRLYQYDLGDQTEFQERETEFAAEN